MSVSKKDQARYAAMAEVEERIEGVSTPGQSVQEADAAALGQQLLLDALGTPDAVRRRVGRPRVDTQGAAGEASPVLQVRISAERKLQLERLKVATHSKSTAEVVRAALDEYIERHQISA